MINLIKNMEEKIMDPITLGVVALMGAVATIGGAAEDIESDIGSQSNPNSQVQLAPQMGHLLMIYLLLQQVLVSLLLFTVFILLLLTWVGLLVSLNLNNHYLWMY